MWFVYSTIKSSNIIIFHLFESPHFSLIANIILFSELFHLGFFVCSIVYKQTCMGYLMPKPSL